MANLVQNVISDKGTSYSTIFTLKMAHTYERTKRTKYIYLSLQGGANT